MIIELVLICPNMLRFQGLEAPAFGLKASPSATIMLTKDTERDPSAPGRRDPVGGDAEVGPVVAAAHPLELNLVAL